MPCEKHPRTDKGCTNCYVAELLQLHTAVTSSTEATNVSELNNTLRRLQKSAPDLSKDASSRDLCRSLIGNLNHAVLVARTRHKLLGKMELFVEPGSSVEGVLVAPSDPLSITDAHRRAYRRLIRQQGIWAGITELHAIARGFRVRFAVHFRLTGATVLVGPPGGQHIRRLALVFEDNHYDVRSVHTGDDDRLVLGEQVPTNLLGDCAFESVLIVLAFEGLHRVHTEAQRSRILARFALLRAQHAARGPMPTDGDYPNVIRDFRAWLATSMDDDEVRDAIVAMAGCVLERGSTGGQEVSLDWNLNLSEESSLPDLPWRGTGLSIKAKQVGADSYSVLRFDVSVLGARVVGANFNPGRSLWTHSMQLLQKWPVTGKGLMPVEGMYSEVLDKKDLEFLADEGRDQNKPTHINTCLVEITAGKTVHRFLCAGVNAEFGNMERTKAKMCQRGQGNGTHSEKFCLGLTQLLLRGFGVALEPALLKSLDSFGTVDAGSMPSSSAHGVTSVRFVFLNIAPMCVTCQGYWGQVRAFLLKQGVGSVECAVLCYVDDIDSWK